MAWSCPLCSRSFKRANQKHYCSDSSLKVFLTGKSEITLSLFDALIDTINQFGLLRIETTKSMIVLVADKPFAYIITLGKTFVDIVLPFPQPYDNNYCFRKIGLVPGTKTYNHHLRLMYPDDLNEEVIGYLEKAFQHGKEI